MRDDRHKAQAEAHEIASYHMTISGMDKYTREEAEDQLGKTWTNLCTLFVHDSNQIADVTDAIEALQDADYIVTTDIVDGRMALEVKITRDVIVRYRSEQ